MVNLVKKYPPLLAAGRADTYPLSYQQERLYYLSQILPDSSVWNLVTSRTLSGNLQVAAMKKAVAGLASRHPVLRSVMDWQGNAPCQSFTRNTDELFTYSDLSVKSLSERSHMLQEQLEELWYHPIRLSGEDLLFQATLIRTEEEKYVMLLKLHHIIADGTSLQILWRDLKLIYNALIDGIPADLPALKLEYGTYAWWQRENFSEEFTKEQERYWLKEFQGELPVLDLPADFPPPVQLSFSGALTSLELPGELVKLLRILCMNNRVILFSGLMAVFYTLLYKLAGQEDIVVGTVFNGRHYGPEFNHPVGFFVNTVAVRMEISDGLKYTDLLKSVHDKVDNAYYMQDYPFERLIRVLNPDRDNNRIPLFRTMFNMVSEGTEEQGFLGLEETKLESDACATQTDLLFDVRQEGPRTFLWAEYNTDLFREETVKQLLGMYLNLLRQIVLSPEAKMEELVLTGPQEQEEILKVFNDTSVPYPADKCIHELFAEQVKRTPDHTALCYGDRQWTYSEVNRQTERLAGQLHQVGVEPGSIVGILAERSPELVIGLLGILKAGAAYLPIDPAYPEERNRFMLEDSGTSILLVQSGLNPPAAWSLKTLVLDQQEAESGPGGMIPEFPIPMEQDEEQRAGRLAYVMYTSGSTGTPKGVMVEHRNVVRLVHDGGFLAIEPEDRLLLTGSPSFDAVTFEIWGSLLNGLPLYLAGDDTLLQAGRLGMFIREKGISLLWLTAALFQQLAEEDPGLFAPLRSLLVGGDQLPVRQVRQVREACPGLRIVNLYGPTENTTFSTCYLIQGEHDTGIPIGKPVPNSTAYILDARGQMQPVGVPGELYVGGDGLARGYLNRPELTAERFVPDPFHPGQRIYKTGDRAKWLPDGNIAFLGRLDNQVKIRGYRVEPGEIETSLLLCSAVTEAAVVAGEDPEGSKYLCAYVVCAGPSAVPEIRDFLNEHLPGYMIPSVIVPLAKLPLTRNGKIDRKQLPAPASLEEPAVLFREPGSAAEKQLAEIWREVLNREQVGADDHFFASGGHSLKAMLLISRINRSFQVELPLREIFQAPTVSRLAARIEFLMEHGRSDSKGDGTAIPYAVPRAEGYPASASQKRMYVLHQMMQEGIGYNVPLVLRAEGTVDACRLETALNLLIQKHEALRTSFHMVNGELVQRIAEDVRLRIEYREAADEAEAGCQVQALIRPFILNQAPLMRAAVIEGKDSSVFLVLDIHHIVTDGVSSGILLRELSRFYEAAATIDPQDASRLQELSRLPETRLDYKDYAAWQQERLGSEALREQEAYWLEQLRGDIPVLNVAADYPRPPVQSFAGDRLSCKADQQLYERLQRTAADNGATLYMILLAGYQVLLSKYSGQEDILVGTPIAGRQHADVQNMVGMFVNTLVMRGYPRGSLSFREYLEEVKAGALGAYEHQEVPFEDLVEKVQMTRDMSRNPLFDTMFALQNMEQSPLVLNGVTFREAEYEYPVSKFDLTLTAEEGEEGLRFEWEYAVKLFKQATVARMAEHYVHILEQVTENPDQRLSAVELATIQEQEEILKVFNDTSVPYPADKCIHELFAEQVKRTPDHTALLFQNESLTYCELDKQVKRLAWRLRDSGIQSGSIVAIIAERSLEMVIGIYAILKAGAAYLPIDPGTPGERLRYMLEDSGTRHVLIHRPEDSSLVDADVTFHLINSLPKDNAAAEEQEELCVNRPDDLAYIIYTSGSTGKPKGVMIEHRSLVNTLLYLQDAYPLTAEGTYLFKTAFTFDVSATELFGWFFQGGRLAILEPGLEREPRGIMEAVRQHKVTHMNFSPSMLDVFLQAVDRRTDMDWDGVEYVFAAGEALKPHVVQSFYERVSGVRLENIYGPTEITIYATAYPTEALDKKGNIPIGRPISNMKAYIVDKYMRLQPPGVAGELCFSGVGLARGYLNQEEMTKEKFVSNPYHPAEMMYRTGDMARWSDDGNIEYLGRLDQQVKVRGYRIEPGEIEQTLLGHPNIRAAVVTIKESSSDLKRLLAYLVLRDEEQEDNWAGYLKRWLPSYMIPEAFVQLKEIPLNASGKADIKRLPDSGAEKNTSFSAPRTMQEIRLIQLLEELLQTGGLGMNDNLFDRGANSIVLVQLAMLLEDEFQTVISIMELMEAPTAEAIFDKISLSARTTGTSILL
ncbi:amino acid adenylation domain-containing protein [Paenibacillus sp. FSL H8-0048]|uniref:amino acid adenylation domain-containing protein n=1 Tax=Paenibacillus sp. FSL H8-0048 TaxID=2954508 RepID=UPI0030FB87DF